MTYDIEKKEEEKTPQLYSTFQDVRWFHSRVNVYLVEEKSHTEVPEGDQSVPVSAHKECEVHSTEERVRTF